MNYKNYNEAYVILSNDNVPILSNLDGTRVLDEHGRLIEFRPYEPIFVCDNKIADRFAPKKEKLTKIPNRRMRRKKKKK